jgi:hypothetical protein
VFVNDSRAESSSTDTAITVTFYGDRAGRWVRPKARASWRPAPPEYLEDPKLPSGTQLVEPAFTGYDVEVFRGITEPGKLTRRARFFTRYNSANAKVIRGTGGG